MARRTAVGTAKRERAPTPPPAKLGASAKPPLAKVKSRRAAVDMSPDQLVKALRTECDALRRDLTAANTRIEALEERRAELAERIAWTLDTLQDLLEDD